MRERLEKREGRRERERERKIEERERGRGYILAAVAPRAIVMMARRMTMRPKTPWPLRK